ncbi:MAG: hypothetical protein ACKO81_18545 [Planctomycetota bacterium]
MSAVQLKLLGVLLGLLLTASLEGARQESEPIELGSRRELLVDRQLIESLDNVRLVLHAPVDRGPVLQFNQPAWEEKHCTYATVLYSERGYQLYYRAGLGSDSDLGFQATAYAESADGIHWTKPSLGLFEVAGNRDNNIVLTNERNDFAVHNFSPFIDTRPGVPEAERYKALGGIKGGLFAYVSADGIHWKPLRDQPVFTEGVFDSQNVSFWSPAEQCYLCYFRTWTGGDFAGYRTISRARSEDFIHWTSEGEMDFGSAPREHLYINQTAPYFRAPHLYLSTAARLVIGREVLTEQQAIALSLDPKYREETRREASDVVLLSSRGGRKMDRTFLGSLVRPGIGYENWISRSNFPALNLVPTGPSEMSLYVVQNYAQADVHLRRYTFRLDGLASAQADAEGGQLLTRPLKFSGTQLRLNYSTSAAGSVRIELCDLNGQPLRGFSAEDCTEIVGNELERVVQWKGDSKLEAWAGMPVRIRFLLKDADLFSFRFE